VRAEVVLPPALSEPDAFAEAAAEVVRARGIEVVLPMTEAAALALLAAPDRLAPAVVPMPSLEIFRQISDKARLLAAAPEVGIAVPEQTAVADRGAVSALDLAALRFPLVVKPARSVGEAGGRRAKFGVVHAADAGELRRRLDALPDAAYPLLLQQRIVGPGDGIFLLVWDGATVAEFAHRRIREKPPSGGVSVYRESVPADASLVERSRALLDRFGWQGVAMIEYKRDLATGTPYLMEINGRFWGSLQLAIDAGVDFPSLLVALARGQHPAPVREYRVGVRSRWWWGDVDHLLARLRHSDGALALPPGSPSRWRAIADFLTLWRPGDRNEILRLDDPKPFVRETVTWLRGR
jgi:predicted ATP-grasp superfamily ATP-dependent carboligase